MTLETIDNLTREQAEEFVKWFDKEIGTGIDIQPSASGDPKEFYCFCSNLYPEEAVKVSEYLKERNIEYY